MRLLMQANERGEWLKWIYIWYLINAALGPIAIVILFVIVYWFTYGTMDVSHFYHPLTIM